MHIHTYEYSEWLVDPKQGHQKAYYMTGFCSLLLDSVCVKKGHFLNIMLLLLMIAAPQGSILTSQKIDMNV